MSNEDLPKLCGEDDLLNSSSDEDGWMELDDDETGDDENTLCLFCQHETKNVALAMAHVKSDHQVDFHVLKRRFNMDQYSFIKMINYIRINKVAPDEIASAEVCKWNDEKYLKPLAFEPWLMFDFDGLEPADDGSLRQAVDGKTNQDQIRELVEMVQHKDSLLEQAAIDIETLRKSIHELIQRQSNDVEKKSDRTKVSDAADNGYFETYAHYGIHHDMLSPPKPVPDNSYLSLVAGIVGIVEYYPASDKIRPTLDEVRTCSYRDAIIKNEDTFRDKLVLDLGCGTSILSMFSSKAGAKKVFSVDQSDIIYHAMDIVRKNNFSNIEFVKGRLEDINLPVDKVDIIVSEWMGYFLLFEGMLDSVIYARDHHLAPNGILMPNRCKIFLLGHGDQNRHRHLISYWNNVYGFDMSCLQKEVLRETSIEVCDPKHVLTEPVVIADLDLMVVDLNYSNFTSEFTLNVNATGKLTALVGYFDTFFELPNQVEFSTSPHATATHWKQAVFYMKDPISVNAGDSITGTFRCRRDPKDARSLLLSVDMLGKTMKYNLN